LINMYKKASLFQGLGASIVFEIHQGIVRFFIAVVVVFLYRFFKKIFFYLKIY